jgi:uncharacterized protein YnzC (UPF0291/DUF896 family)
MAQETISEVDILAEVVAPDQPGLTPASARALLELRFNDRATHRMNELAEKNRKGEITESERSEMDKYIRVGAFLNLMQAKARLSLEGIEPSAS